MKLMKTEDAVGQVLCHDITQIYKKIIELLDEIVE